MRTRLLAAALLLLLIAPLAFSADVAIIPKKTGAVTAKVSLGWHVDLQGQKLSELSVGTFGFKDYPYQQLISEETFPITIEKADDFRNKILEYNLDPSQDYQSFSMESTVKVQFRPEYADATDASNFLAESGYIKITPEIRQKAQQIAANYDSDMAKAVALAQWAHNNVKYDRNYISIVKDSDSVFSERAGTCDEFSHLFIAMLRAVDIPAKFSASYVYSGTDWGAHAFVEAAIGGKWYPFDPTFNEGIILDATHLKFGEGLDQGDIKEDITIKSLNADVSKLRLTRDFDVQFLSTQNFPELFKLSLLVPSKVVGEGSIETVKVRLTNKQHRLAVPLSLLLPREVRIVGENKYNEDKLILLEPFEEKEAEWKIIIPSLESGYDYTFPLMVESLGQDVNATISASKDGDVAKRELVEITGLSSNYDDGRMSILLILKNTGNVDSTGSVSLGVDEIATSIPLKAYSLLVGREQTIAFSFDVPENTAKSLTGEIVLKGNTIDPVVQRFTISLDGSAKPTFSASSNPSGSLTPTPQPDIPSIPGIPSDYLMILLAILTILLLVFVKSVISK